MQERDQLDKIADVKSKTFESRNISTFFFTMRILEQGTSICYVHILKSLHKCMASILGQTQLFTMICRNGLKRELPVGIAAFSVFDHGDIRGAVVVLRWSGINRFGWNERGIYAFTFISTLLEI